MMSVGSNFNFLCGRPHGAGTPSPGHMRPPEPDPLPLRVDVINGWPRVINNSTPEGITDFTSEDTFCLSVAWYVYRFQCYALSHTPMNSKCFTFTYSKNLRKFDT